MNTRFSRTAVLLSALLGLSTALALPAAAQSSQVQRQFERLRPAFPMMELGASQLRGQQAIDRLGQRLGEVASWYGMSADTLRKQLLSDHRLRLDRKGRMFVVDDAAPQADASVAEAPAGVIDGQLLPIDQTFKLHSRPGANRTIYLDFDGATLTGTNWNAGDQFNPPRPTINARAFDLDGVPTSFSTAELQRIQFIWQRVAEDYAVFDVDVTTELPPPDRLARSSSADTVFGTTVLVTHNEGVYNCSCGGVAYVGVFSSTTTADKPALVFYNMLASGNEKSVAEAISHEAGHNMGLSHDGTSTDSYYGGQGTSSVTGWAPIMGVGYYKPLTQFSKGEYANANNRQDDFAVMQQYGLPLRADDYGSTPATAAALPASGGSIDGVISVAGDVDLFSFSAGAGAFSATLSPASRSPNADLVLTLLNSSGTVLATSNPADSLGAAISTTLPANGNYLLQVTATGLGSPTTTGYSSYGSVGNYRVAASYPAFSAGTPNPVLTASRTTAVVRSAIKLDASRSTDADGTVKAYYWDFGDGTLNNTGSLRSTTKSYAKPGKYTVRLTVKDNSGLQASTTQLITVTATPSAAAATTKTLTMQAIKLNLDPAGTTARGVITVLDQRNKPISGAQVSVAWGGLVGGSAKALTNRNGQAAFVSPAVSGEGCLSLTVNNIVRTGYRLNKPSLGASEVCR